MHQAGPRMMECPHHSETTKSVSSRSEISVIPELGEPIAARNGARALHPGPRRDRLGARCAWVPGRKLRNQSHPRLGSANARDDTDFIVSLWCRHRAITREPPYVLH